jgi:hypothetical protein
MLRYSKGVVPLAPGPAGLDRAQHRIKQVARCIGNPLLRLAAVYPRVFSLKRR